MHQIYSGAAASYPTKKKFAYSRSNPRQSKISEGVNVGSGVISDVRAGAISPDALSLKPPQISKFMTVTASSDVRKTVAAKSTDN